VTPTDHRIQQLLENTLNMEVRSAEVDLIQDGLLDSLMFVELLVGLEDIFGIKVDVVELDIEDFRTVRRIGLLLARLGASEAINDH
jgi:methoxymalonate biosynthesis acyl carrier protein